MTSGHRERLIREKLFVPLSDDEITERKSADPKLLSEDERYDWVVYRADYWFRRVNEDYGINRCEEAELIESWLKKHEADRLADTLKNSDRNQPLGGNGELQKVYKVCTRAQWDAWELQRKGKCIVKRAVYEKLMADIEYAKKSGNIYLLYEAKGAIEMAYELKGLFNMEYVKLIEEAVRKGINDHSIRRKEDKSCL